MESRVPKRIDGLVLNQDKGTLAVSRPGGGQILLTNRVGGRILELADGTRNLDALCETLAGEFSKVDPARLRGHVGDFLADAEKKGILAFAAPPAPGRRPGSSGLTVLANERAPGQGDSQHELREKERKFHPDVYWYLTFRCNLACTHCSVLSSPWVDTSGDLSTADCMQVVDQLAEMNVSMAMLSGGEALIRPDAVAIIRALGERNIYVGVESNGLRFAPDFIALAKEMQARDLMNITVSLDGGTEESNAVLRGPRAFDRTVRGLRLLRDNGIQFDVQCVVNRENYHTIPQLYDLMAELGPDRMLWSPLNSSGRGNEIIRRVGLRYEDTVAILELIALHKHRFAGPNIIKFPPAMVPPRHLLQVYKGKDVGCVTSCKFPLLGVLPNGDITVCAVSRDDDALYFGNIRSVRLKAAWEKARMDLLRARYVGAEDLTGICGDCVWKYNCKGSCRAMAYEAGEDFFAPFPTCQDAADRGVFPDVYRISKGGRGIAIGEHSQLQL